MMLIERLVAVVEGLRGSGIENPNTPLTKANFLAASGNQSSSGVMVNRDTVLGHPSIFRGISLIANDSTKIPRFVYRKRGDNREADLNHPASPLLRQKANPAMRSDVFLKTLIGHALLHRGGYAFIQRDQAGVPLRMEVLDPEQTYPIVVNGRLFYQSFQTGVDRVIPAENIYHIRGLGWDGLDGWSVMDKLKEAIGSGLAAQKFTSVYFRNNAQPRVVIKFPGYLADQTAVERFRASWGNVHGGVENAHKPAILEGGAEVEPFQMSNEDAQLVELRELDNRVVSTILGIPSHMLNDDTKTSFASLEQENQRYLDQSIDPWLREIEGESNDKLLTEREKQTESVFVEFVRQAFVRTNIEDRYSAYNTGIQSGFLSRAEVRRFENLNVDDEELEDFMSPLNMSSSGTEPVPAAESDRSMEQSWKRLAEHRCKQLLTRIAKHAARAAQRAPSEFSGWVETELRASHYDKFVDDFTVMCGHAGAAETVADGCFNALRAGLQEITDQVSTVQLPESVSQVVNSYLVDLPPSVSGQLMCYAKEQYHEMGSVST